MPRNSTGNYTLPLPPVVSGELIEAAWANTTLDDVGQAITDSLDRYGRGGMLAAFLFADGSVSNPGAAWANAPGTGFFRDSAHLGFSWNGAEIFSYNQTGLSGKISSATVTGMLNFPADINAGLQYLDAAAAPAWFVGTSNAVGDESFGIYNAATLAWALQVDPTTNDITYGGGGVYAASDIEFRTSGGVVFFRQDGVTRAWKVAGGTFASGDFGFYNLGLSNWGLLFESANNNATFAGTIFGEQQIQVGDPLGFYFRSNATQSLWGSASDYAGTSVSNLGAYCGYQWYIAGAAERHFKMVNTGDLWLYNGSDINGTKSMSVTLAGAIRGQQFVATPNP